MSVLRFQTNVPAEVALAYDGGKEVEGQYGPQIMFSLAAAPGGENTMYLPPHVAERMRELRIAKGERFAVTKAEVKSGNRKGIEWQVQRVDPPKQSELAAPPHANGNGAATREVTGDGPAPNGHSTTPVRNNHTPVPFVATGHGQFLLSAIVNTIDICAAAQQYAAAKGMAITFSSEDIRAFAISTFIQHSRENGGGR